MEVRELGGDECTIVVGQPKSSRIACRIALGAWGDACRFRLRWAH